MQANQRKEEPFEVQARTNLLIQLGPTKIKSLKLSIKAVNRLARVGVTTIADLASMNQNELSLIHGVGEKTLAEIQNALEQVLNSPAGYIEAASLESAGEVSQKQSPQTWSEIIEPFLRSEKENRIYVFISRSGFKKKTLRELAAELNVSCERIRHIERRAADELISHTGLPTAIRLLDKIIEVLSEGQENLSLPSLKSILTEKGILGEFSEPVRTKRYDADPFEILVGWLDILSDDRFTEPPVSFPIEIGDLRKAASLPIREYKALRKRSRKKINPRAKELLRKVAYTGGIHLTDAMKILSADVQTPRLDLRNLNLLEIREGWFSVASLKSGRKSLRLILAANKMFSSVEELEFSAFYEGLSRWAGRYFDSIAPPDIVLYYIELAGFEVKQNRLSNPTKVEGVLSQAELCLIDAIRANGNVASHKEIAAALRRKGFSKAALAPLLAHSPIPARLDRALYKIRGFDVSGLAVAEAKKRQRDLSH